MADSEEVAGSSNTPSAPVTTESGRVFVSFASADATFAEAFVNFLRLGCNLGDEQIFMTARPGTIPPGTQFVEVIATALRGADVVILLLTPAYYGSRFCLAEAGAVWISDSTRIPMLVPPVDYHDLEGVQLGEQAMRIDRSSDLDDLREIIKTVLDRQVPTSRWNQHKEAFLLDWETELRSTIAESDTVPGYEHREALDQLESVNTELTDVKAVRDQLRDFARELKTQNDQFREDMDAAPPAPTLAQDENARYLAEADLAISLAKRRMDELPRIVKEAMFQHYHDGRSLTVGGAEDTFPVGQARKEVEQGYLSWVEDEPQTVTARWSQPDVDKAKDALNAVRESVFDGTSFHARSDAGDWIAPYLKEKYELDDPTFELRPVWEALGFI